MRYQDLKNKEIIDINKGKRLGLLGQTDLDIDEKTGKVLTFKIEQNQLFNFNKETNHLEIKWHAIKKIGTDTIIVDRLINQK